MNDDYLWDKSGGDIEIERIEESLSAFRYQPMPSPATGTSAKTSQWSGLRFLLTPSLAVAAIAIVFGVWFSQSSSDERPTRALSINGPAASVSGTPQNDEIVELTEPKPVAIKERRKIRPVKRDLPRTILTASRTRPEKLTDEERNAYDQVLLALSITGTKLKIVQETVNGGSREAGRDNR